MINPIFTFLNDSIDDEPYTTPYIRNEFLFNNDQNSLDDLDEDKNNVTIQQSNQIDITGRNRGNLRENTQALIRELNPHIGITFQTTIIEKTKLGRKLKRSNEKGKHNKYSVDHIIHKIKTHMIKYLMTFINNIFSNNHYKDKILKINAERANNNTIEYNEKLLKMTLKELFSVSISGKNGKKYYDNPNHNTEVLDKIYKEQNSSVNNVLDSTFSECIKHFRGTKLKDALLGLEDYYNEFINKLKEKNEEDYVEKFQKVLLNYENEIKQMQSKKKQ
jgi:hypothetical protein